MEEGMKKMALVVAGLVAILLTFNLTGKVQKWLKDREAEDLASKAFWKNSRYQQYPQTLPELLLALYIHFSDLGL